MRIITGTAKGCRLKAPKGMNTRPTADRVKESLFAILGATVCDNSILDVFAGTGALGLEALSRGAAQAVFVDKVTAALIRDNATHTKLTDKAQIIGGDVRKILPQLQKRGLSFGIIFADPPYGSGLADELLGFVDTGTLLAPDGVFIIEHSAVLPLPQPQNLALIRRESYGSQICLDFYRYKVLDGGCV